MHSREGVSIEIAIVAFRLLLMMHSREGVSIEIIMRSALSAAVDALPRGSEY